MDLQTNLKKYAKLLVKAGCNLQKGQSFLVNAQLEAAPLVRFVVDEAYRAGAKEVNVFWSDEAISRMQFLNSPLEFFRTFPKWKADALNGFAERGDAMLFLESRDPNGMSGVDTAKIITRSATRHKACKAFHEGMDFGRNVWCIAAAASPKWAKCVFPGLNEDEATEKLWEAIFHTVRVDTPDPVKAWNEHRKSFEKRCSYLNAQQFDKLVYKNSIGTDITLGMTKNHIWAGGGSRTVGGTYFFPNMPTEEIFCSPDYRRTNGTVHSALPLNYQGVLIDDFSITFQDGKAVECRATKGEETLKRIIAMDEGAHMLGECALIPHKSPIADTGILFYNTLFDENAACHFALGIGFPECIKDGLSMSKDQLTAAGINSSVTHVDFMLGTEDLSITGITQDGEEVPVFRNGGWAF